MGFARKSSRVPQVQESTAGVTNLYMGMPPKICCIFPINVEATLLWFKEWCSWNIAVTWLRLVSRLHPNTSSPGIYWRIWPNQWANLELCHRNLGILERVLNQIALSNSTLGKCTPMQVVKQLEHGRTSTNEEQKYSSFQMNYD